MKKWDDFRHRRASILDEYLSVKKRQQSLIIIIQQSYLLQFLKKIWHNAFSVRREEIRNWERIIFTMVKLYCRYRRRRLKIGKNYLARMRLELRNCFTFHTHCSIDFSKYQIVRQCLLPFLTEMARVDNFKQLFRNNYDRIVFI